MNRGLVALLVGEQECILIGIDFVKVEAGKTFVVFKYCLPDIVCQLSFGAEREGRFVHNNGLRNKEQGAVSLFYNSERMEAEERFIAVR